MLLRWILYNFLRCRKFAKIRYRFGKHILGEPYVISGCVGDDMITVGNFTSIANDVVLIPSSGHTPEKQYEHLRLSTFPLTSMKGNCWNNKYWLPDKGNKIIIGNDCWLASGVKVLPNVIIGDGAIVGSGAIVVDNLPPYSVSVGVPAKVVRYRYTSVQIDALLRIKWWTWTDKKIHDNLDLFYGEVDRFIEKFDTRDPASP